MTFPQGAVEILRRADERRVASCQKAVRDLEQGGFAWPLSARVRVLSNCTLELLAAPLKLAAYRRGIAVDIAFSDFGTYAQEILDSGSRLGHERFDLVMLGLWLDDMPLAFSPQGTIDAERVVEHIGGLVARLLERTAGRVALVTQVTPLRRLMTPRDEVALARINLAMWTLAERHERVSVIDLQRLIERLGEASALDPRGALMQRAPFTPELCALWASRLVDGMAAAHGAQRKVLALDCDGTLWGGILGEEGPDGIRLSAEEYPGSAYVAFQEQVLALQRGGALVVLCSKNEDADVMRVLASHPHARLRPEHVVARRINWKDKVDNLRSLADELHVALDSFVFIDDSPYECARVREALPMVDVRQVPQHACDLLGILHDVAPGFGGGLVTAEDRVRTQLIQAEGRRIEAAQAAVDLDTFLLSLGLVAEIGPPDLAAVARVAQLTQRTNQFNATTRRYTMEAVTGFLNREDALVLALWASDRFGDDGLVGVAIAVREQDKARIDTFLLSCRALGRRLEDALLGELRGEMVRRWGPIPIWAEVVRTAKNGQLQGFFEARGFDRVESTEGRWVYQAVDGAHPSTPPFITVRRKERA